MKISEMDLSKYTAERKKVIVFAKDGNTVVQPYRTLYNVQQFTGNEAHKNLWLEFVQNDYGKEAYLYEDLGICIYKICHVLGNVDISEFTEMCSRYQYFGKSGYLKRLEASENNGGYINNLDIQICALIGENGLAKHYAEYRAAYLQKRKEKIEAEEKERQEREEKERAELEAEQEKKLDAAEQKIFDNVDFKVESIYKISVINLLMKRHGINVPLRTQGWINKKLAMIVFPDGKISYKFYGKSQRDNSTVFYNYLEELEAKIAEKYKLMK